MKILYIWGGLREELGKREDNIRSVLEMYPDVEILMATRNKDFKCSQDLKARFIYLDMDELLKDTECKQAHYYSESDHIRWNYCAKHENILYLDTDITAIKKMPEEIEFGVSKFDECSIYSGNRPDICAEFYDKFNHEHILYTASIGEFGWNEPECMTDLTPYFKHHGTSSEYIEQYFIDLERLENEKLSKNNI